MNTAIAPTLSASPDERGLGGLIALVEGKEKPFPLSEVRVRARITGVCCRTVVEQVFDNPFDAALEALHIFPLPEDGAVLDLELRAGELVVRAECREKEEAEKIFAEARDRGHRAALLSAERDDVHTLRVTNVPPKARITVRFVVIEQLDTVDGSQRWRFPTVIAPRYLPGEPVGHEGDGMLPDSDRVPDASRLQPPLRLHGGTRLDLEVEISGPVRGVTSSLHAVRMELDGGAVRVAPSGKATLNQDFVLAITTADDGAAAARAWTDGTHTLVQVDPPAVALPEPLPRDAVFVVDISGSMEGGKLEAARQALLAALHGLLPGDRFQLIAFDDRLELFAQGLVAYDARSQGRADRWIEALAARGGTEMLAPIQAALAGETPEGRLRTVLFITDGQAWNEAELVAAVANRRGRARFFTLGIDTAVNGSLLKKLARVGGGTCELATPEDDLEAVVAQLEARFGSPLLEEVKVEGKVAAGLEPTVVFSGRPASLLIEGSPERVTVQARGPEGIVELEAEVRPGRKGMATLFARRRIAALQDRLILKPFEAEALRPQILELALGAGLVSRFTSLVAVERSLKLDLEKVSVVQPVEPPAQWGGLPSAGPAAPSPMFGRPRPMRRRSHGVLASGAPPRARAKSSGLFSGIVDGLASAFGMAGGASTDDDVPTLPAEAAAEEEERELRRPAAKKKRSAPRQEADRPDAVLARTQEVDGSFGGDVSRTAAALVALVKLGSTRRTGLRRRTVLKAAQWLEAHRDHPDAALALQILEAAERGEPIGDGWRKLTGSGAEGRLLATLTGA